jgi:hypothetical protein
VGALDTKLSVTYISDVKTSRYYDAHVRCDRPEVKDEYVQFVLDNAEEVREQESDGHFQMWAFIEVEQKYLKIVTRPDRETVHTAYFDRPYTRRKTK